MATTGADTEREPRIALGVELARTRPRLASIADIAIALDVLTGLITDEPRQVAALSRRRPQTLRSKSRCLGRVGPEAEASELLAAGVESRGMRAGKRPFCFSRSSAQAALPLV